VIETVKRIQFTEVGPVFKQGWTSKDWWDAWRDINRERKGIQFNIGGLLNAGALSDLDLGFPHHENIEKRIGGFLGKYGLAAGLFEEEYQTLRNWAWVERHLPLSRRRDKLSWTHHAEVAALPPAQQSKYLARAEKEKWSAGKLRRELRSARRGLNEPLVTSAGWIAASWVNEGLRQLEPELIITWSSEAKSELKAELERIRKRIDEILSCELKEIY
jgi:hypothetical protein